jgi:hypothetical protein
MLDNYKYDKNGVIQQIKVAKITYDHNYIEKRYNKYISAENMSHLRLGYLIGIVGGGRFPVRCWLWQW